jgi:hypothetical protein
MASPTSWSRITRMDVGVAQKEAIFNSALDLLDAIQNGNLSIALSDANTLLSETQQCNGTIVFTGTLTAGRTIYIRVSTDGTVNARPGAWRIFNNTNQTLTFKLATVAGSTPTSFGTGATVATTKKRILAHTNPAGAGASGDVYAWTAEL